MSDVPGDDHPIAYCLNCGTALSGKYCSSCGQRNIPNRQTLGELLTNFIGSFFSFESKFFTTFRHILINPGFLAKEFNEGRRERYFHPARAYVFCSFVFFLIVFWDDSDFKGSFTLKTDGQERPFVRNDSSGVRSRSTYDTLIEYKTFQEYDSVQSRLPEEKRDGFLERFVERRAIELNTRYDGEQLESHLANTFMSNFPKVFFLLLPVFAILLKLLYIRRDYYYSEHLVFSTMYYNSFFCTVSVGLLIGNVPYMGWLEILIYIWIPICLLIGMKVMYRQRWWKTILKYMGFVFLFTLCVGIGLLINLFVTLVQI